jgi:hypothetical protein
MVFDDTLNLSGLKGMIHSLENLKQKELQRSHEGDDWGTWNQFQTRLVDHLKAARATLTNFKKRDKRKRKGSPTEGYSQGLYMYESSLTGNEGAIVVPANIVEAAAQSQAEAAEAAELRVAQASLVHSLCAGPKPRAMQQPSRKRPRTINSSKAKPPPPSGFYGVTANGKRWKSTINYGNKQHLGYFDTKQEAALAYDKAAREHAKEKPVNYESITAAAEAAAQAQAEYTLVHVMYAVPKHRPPSGFHGVSANEKRWRAQIQYSGKNHYLGIFDTKQEAAFAYDKAAREHGGGKKLLNYESIEAAEEAASHAQAEHTLVRDVRIEPKRPRQPSGFHGVTAKGKRWQAQINYGGKIHYIGIFTTKQEAALAYDTAAREHGGGKRKLNYESIKAAEEAAAHAQAAMLIVFVDAPPEERRLEPGDWEKPQKDRAIGEGHKAGPQNESRCY